jgi:ferredoxin-NADP reductase/ferredoxin/predicted pyridoxine 5'-phosphate oxidase superfamily flavin-nucleotide-binding protein
MTSLKTGTESPFHEGEQFIQTKTGKRDAMETFGRRVIRSFMPEQHREFYQSLPFVVVGSVDNSGDTWASILPGRAGFLQSPTPTTLTFDSGIVLDGDPLNQSLSGPGAALGLLGITLDSKRRNRVNVRVSETSGDLVELRVDQAFGNCPQYIQTRELNYTREPEQRTAVPPSTDITELDNDAARLIDNADTFFVSSFIAQKDNPTIEGVDVSHRGGMPGFVKREGNVLTIPDYAGNFHFNTLGNFLLNLKAGLVFIDFETGDLLMLSGSVEILWEDHPDVLSFKGAERAWRLTLKKGKWLKKSLPFTAAFNAYSANSKITGNWSEAADRLEAESTRNTWQSMKVVKIEQESSIIKSFYFKHAKEKALLPFKSGQHLTIQVKPSNSEKSLIRSYTVSSAPNDDHYRLSIKKVTQGVVSSFMHDELKVGDVINAKYPKGDFYIDVAEKRPAVLIAGGIGVTPMMSMALHTAKEGLRARYIRPLNIFYSAKTSEQRAFYQQFKALESATEGAIRFYSFLSRPDPEDKPGIDFNAIGHINADIFRQLLGLDDYDFYLCGPASFMQSLYDELMTLGIRDKRIHSEAFGPATIKRPPEINRKTNPAKAYLKEADEAVIKFTGADFEQRWNTGDGSILEVAESHGLEPEFACRNGVCGTCAVRIKSGKVAYRNKPSAQIQADEALICCAIPAQGTTILEVEL